MITHPRTGLFFVLLALALAACVNQSKEIGGQQALDIIWEELKPHTSSKDRNEWEIGEVRQVSGRDVVGEFADASHTYCPGPVPPENQAIQASGEYWFILVRPHPATPIPQERTPSPTEPPLIPEPFVREASFLVDKYEGQIVARKLVCVVY